MTDAIRTGEKYIPLVKHRLARGLYPLQRDFRRRLCAPLDPQPNP